MNLMPEDAAALDALIEGRPRLGVFLSKGWLSGFFAEPPAGFEPAVVLLRQAGVLRAIAPLAVRQTFTHVQIGLLGGGFGSDRIDLLTAKGFEALASDTFLRWLQEAFGRKAFVLDLRDVPSDSPLWGAVQRAGVEQTMRLALQPREIHTLPYLDLADARSAVVNGVPHPLNARSLNKHRRWLEGRCRRLRVELLDDPSQVADAFDSLVQFLHARWRNHGNGSALDNPRTVRFHRRALPLLLAERRLRMIRISADTRAIAVFYGLASGKWWGYYLAGYDRDWAGRIRLGQITLATAIEVASREGATEFDFLKGADRVKYLWPVRERATLDADVYTGQSGAQLKRATRATREAAVAFAKSARNLIVQQRRS
jgi:CelD/BcsL family acetyltransferase involved in cellulose biosynthesis